MGFIRKSNRTKLLNFCSSFTTSFVHYPSFFLRCSQESKQQLHLAGVANGGGGGRGEWNPPLAHSSWGKFGREATLASDHQWRKVEFIALPNQPKYSYKQKQTAPLPALPRYLAEHLYVPLSCFKTTRLGSMITNKERLCLIKLVLLVGEKVRHCCHGSFVVRQS